MSEAGRTEPFRPAHRGTGAEFGAAWGILVRNFNLVRRYLSWEIVFLFYTLINTLTIGLIGVDQAAASMGTSADGMILYLVVGALLWGFLSVLFSEVSQSVSWERWEGTIEYTFMAPVRRASYLGGVCLFAMAYGLVRTVVIMVAASVFFSLDLGGANLGGALLVLVAASFSFIGLGLMAAVLPLMSPERGSQATHIVQGMILLVSGVYYSVDVLPGWLRPLSIVSPATYTLRAAREALLAGAPVTQLRGDIAILVLFGTTLVPLGLYVFSLGERYALRTGKLKRSG
ncbi:MAG: ABC transporter permease [Bacillota bacterium]